MAIDLDQLIRDADPARGLLIDKPDPATARTAMPRRPRHRRRGMTIAVPGLVVLVAVAVVALAVTLGGHRSVTQPAAIAPPPRTGVVLVQTHDPAGGLPWGLALVRAGGGRVCLQVGRVKSGRLGTIDAGGAFHPLRRTDRSPGPATCTTPDPRGNVFFGVLTPDVSAGGGRHPSSAALGRRTIEYGLYGPDVASVTSVAADGRLVTRPAGPGGSYLSVLPQTATVCRPGVRPCIDLRAQAGTAVISGVLTAVNYRNGSVCHLVDHLTGMCSAEGRVFAPPKVRAPVVARSRVAAPGTARAVPARFYCAARGQSFGTLVPCDHATPPGDVRIPGTGSRVHEELFRLTFTARLPAGSDRQYMFSYHNPCGGGGGGPVASRSVRAGQRITVGFFLSSRTCLGRYTGEVAYGPRRSQFAPGAPLLDSGSVLVGRFAVTVAGGS
jgi:hypothetical protein